MFTGIDVFCHFQVHFRDSTCLFQSLYVPAEQPPHAHLVTVFFRPSTPDPRGPTSGGTFPALAEVLFSL